MDRAGVIDREQERERLIVIERGIDCEQERKRKRGIYRKI